ncbi:MAG: hypothetical protein ACLPYS_02775 [Vulcanimicrobiaceae bacterium]
MSGVMVFQSLREAVLQGYQVAQRTERGYLVRIKTGAGWAMALVDSESAVVRAGGHYVGQ